MTSQKYNIPCKYFSSQISSLFDELATLVKERKQSVLAELTEVLTSKEQVLEEQKLSLQQHLTRINSCCELTEDSLQSGTNTDIVMVKKEMTGKVSQML